MDNLTLTQTKQVAIIGAASGLGAQIKETGKGPDSFYELGLLENLKSFGIKAHWSTTIYTEENNKSILEKVATHASKLADVTEAAIKSNEFPLILGGDHAIAAGSWAGIIKALNLQENFGLIWIDAHMDANTPETSPSNAYHGMPVAALLGRGEKLLTDIGGFAPKIKPEHIILIGIRSFEEGEENLLKELGVKIYYIEEVKKRSFATVFAESLEHLNKHTQGIGLSIDLDAFDPSIAPGIGSPEKDGLLEEEVLPYLKEIYNTGKFKALEITEYNPDLDKDNKTFNLVVRLLTAIL